ncbi:hypothetical protein UFOVP1247_54 [uncultured Caudovirales phage]|uniref:Uncharacterized protein n=1 Tax=uncultured Caudovirales phage TaxID=2100421 RepID=A0A6J5R8L7_9CAUD|nr:hypothetical protein UFOVP970_94 [uncultured Caudovirales phage]CAB4193303.1 hypothetical protein UFOVP1247_54 [uncultured Caudovirales phage]
MRNYMERFNHAASYIRITVDVQLRLEHQHKIGLRSKQQREPFELPILNLKQGVLN